MRVRPAGPEDVSAMQEVFRSAGAAAWQHILPAEALAANTGPARWADDLAGALVAEADGRVVGFAVVRPHPEEERVGELDALYTEPTVWGRGAGRALLDAALARLAELGFREATLWTEERNERPRRIYEQYGWKHDGVVREREYRGTALRERRYRIELPFLPDLATLSDADLRLLIRDLQRREHGVSFERRLLHGRIAVLERELEIRDWARRLS